MQTLVERANMKMVEHANSEHGFFRDNYLLYCSTSGCGECNKLAMKYQAALDQEKALLKVPAPTTKTKAPFPEPARTTGTS